MPYLHTDLYFVYDSTLWKFFDSFHLVKKQQKAGLNTYIGKIKWPVTCANGTDLVHEKSSVDIIHVKKDFIKVKI